MEQIPGPRYFQALCAPNDDGSIETRSGSSRSSFGQVSTRLILFLFGLFPHPVHLNRR